VGYQPPPVGASPNVIINGSLAHRVGDLTFPHYAFLPVPPDLHPDVIATGDPTVLVNGRPIAIVGLSILAPSGVVAGYGAIDVIVKCGNLNNATVVGGFFVEEIVA
jgi:uncharacterized Zn-binding protein involved in type VI secretion